MANDHQIEFNKTKDNPSTVVEKQANEAQKFKEKSFKKVEYTWWNPIRFFLGNRTEPKKNYDAINGYQEVYNGKYIDEEGEIYYDPGIDIYYNAIGESQASLENKIELKKGKKSESESNLEFSRRIMSHVIKTCSCRALRNIMFLCVNNIAVGILGDYGDAGTIVQGTKIVFILLTCGVCKSSAKKVCRAIVNKVHKVCEIITPSNQTTIKISTDSLNMKVSLSHDFYPDKEGAIEYLVHSRISSVDVPYDGDGSCLAILDGKADSSVNACFSDERADACSIKNNAIRLWPISEVPIGKREVYQYPLVLSNGETVYETVFIPSSDKIKTFDDDGFYVSSCPALGVTGEESVSLKNTSCLKTDHSSANHCSENYQKHQCIKLEKFAQDGDSFCNVKLGQEGKYFSTSYIPIKLWFENEGEQINSDGSKIVTAFVIIPALGFVLCIGGLLYKYFCCSPTPQPIREEFRMVFVAEDKQDEKLNSSTDNPQSQFLSTAPAQSTHERDENYDLDEENNLFPPLPQFVIDEIREKENKTHSIIQSRGIEESRKNSCKNKKVFSLQKYDSNNEEGRAKKTRSTTCISEPNLSGGYNEKYLSFETRHKSCNLNGSSFDHKAENSKDIRSDRNESEGQTVAIKIFSANQGIQDGQYITPISLSTFKTVDEKKGSYVSQSD